MSKTPLSHSVIFSYFLRTPPQCCNSSWTPPGTISDTHTQKKKTTQNTWYSGSKEFLNQLLYYYVEKCCRAPELGKAWPCLHSSPSCVSVSSQRFSCFLSLPVPLLTEKTGLPPTSLFSQAGSACSLHTPAEKQQAYQPYSFSSVKNKVKSRALHFKDLVE